MAEFSYLEEADGKDSMGVCVDEVEQALNSRFTSERPYTKSQLVLALQADTALKKELPRTLIWNDDSLDVVVEKLDRMLNTPMGQTENQIPGIQKDIDVLNKVLCSQGHSGFSANFCVSRLLLRVEDRGDTTAGVYFDRGREYIQYANNIREDLISQFGAKVMGELQREFPEFYRKLENMSELALQIEHDKTPAIEFNEKAASKTTLMPVRTIYFNGMSDGIKGEIRELTDHIRSRNASNSNPDGSIVVPVFAKYDASLGNTLTGSARNGVLKSSMYVEIIGDGFGDASRDMARAAYSTAKARNIPRLILVKENRTAKHPEYAQEHFLDIVDPGDIAHYSESYEATQKFDERYLRTFTGKVPLTDIHQRWREGRASLLAEKASE